MSKKKAKGAGRGGRGGFRGGGRSGPRSGGNRDTWGSRNDIERKNARYEDYYNKLGILNEEEQEIFWSAMRSDLPSSFRFTGSRGHALLVQRRLIDRYIPEITAVEYEGEKVAPPQPIDWYPSNLAWSMTTPKNVIRRFPPFAAFQKFLVSENSVGNITRQEVVSMIPPLFMEIKPGMTVLDLCAAPGSKSAQLIEMVHGGEEARVRKVLEKIAGREGKELEPKSAEVEAAQELIDTEADYADDGRSTGLLIANDKDYRRAQMLVHQTKRLNSPNLIVTNHDATLFPSLRLPPSHGRGSTYLKFDRILADVPCSGDGTARKNLDVWRQWTPANALGLHPAQVRILVRSLQMLKVGGRVVYSTCSMNPVENEAVVAEAILRCGGVDNVELVSTADVLPGLKRREGMRSWTVTDREGRAWSSYADVKEARRNANDESTDRLIESVFAPAPEAEVPLHRCLRVYPHLQDTGGFFVAVLQKKTEIKVRPEAPKMPTAQPGPEDAPLSAAVSEIQHQTTQDAKKMAKVDAADGLEAEQNSSEDTGSGTAQKREHETNALEDVSTNKRLKLEGVPIDYAKDEEEERKVHYPPPPTIPPNPHDTSVAVPGPARPLAPQIAADFAPGKRKQSSQPTEEAFIYLDPKHEELQSVYEFYSLSPRFPRDRFMVRNASGTPAKAIYYTSASARDVLKANEGKGIKFVHAGVKMFVKQDVQSDTRACKWRIQAEGLPLVEAWLGPQRALRIHDPAVLRVLLREMFPRTGPAGDADAAEHLGELAPQVWPLCMGCCVLRVEPHAEMGLLERLVLPLWRGVSSVNLMLPKEDRKAMLLRLFNDESALIDTHQQRKAAAAQPDPEDALSSNASDDGDDGGGIPLSMQTNADSGSVQHAAVDTSVEGTLDAAAREVQHVHDTTKKRNGEVITDEDDELNKTV